MLERYGRNGGPIHREGCGVPQNGTPRDTVHLHRRPPPASTGYCSSIVDLLQPPPATVHPRAPVHPASTTRYSTGYCSTSPLHGLLFNHPSTGYCSSCPPRGPVHPAPTGSIDWGSVHPKATPWGTVHPPPLGTVHPNPPATITVHPNPPSNTHCSSIGSIDRLQLAAVAKESLGFS